MDTNQIIILIPSSIIALATVAYSIFSGITISKLNKQNKLLLLDSHNKLASFLKEEWKNAGYNKIVAKVKNYSSYSLIKSFQIKPKNNSPEQIEFFENIKNIKLLTVDELDKVIGLTRKLNNFIKEGKINIDTVLLYFEFIYGDTEWVCNENYNIIINCVNSLYKSEKDRKIKVINEFFNNIVKNRNYSKLAQSIRRNIKFS